MISEWYNQIVEYIYLGRFFIYIPKAVGSMAANRTELLQCSDDISLGSSGLYVPVCF